MSHFYFNYISPWLLNHGIKIFIIVIVSFVIQKTSKHFIEKTVRKFVKGDPFLAKDSEMRREDTLIRITSGIMRVVLWLVVVLMILSEVGVNIGPLIAGAGVVGIAVGFGGQYLIRDLISGFFIIIENQYRIGDGVEIAGVSGKVEDISLRVTVLRDLDGVVHHIPHGEVTKVSNKTKGISKINLDIGVGYSSDLNKVKEIVDRVGKELSEEKEYFGVMIKEAPHFLRVENLGDSAIVVKIVGITEPGKQYEVAGELRKRIKESFDKEGIEIPFPQMVVHKSKN